MQVESDTEPKDLRRMTYETINDAQTIAGEIGSSLGYIDQYELLRELGGGGFGTVYLARDTVAGIDVAVKGLPPMIRDNAEELERIRENFALISRLHHPNIAAALVLHPAKEVTYSDPSVRQKLRVDSGDTLMVMEYVPGVTLSRWRKQFPGGKVPLEPAIQIVWQIAQALDFAHEQHIIHRDIKPSNVMVETKPDGEVVARLLDFGLAAEIRSSMGRISREIHDTSGTRPFMAPEQWAGRKQVPATDQYALAVLLYEILTGEVPFASAFETGDPMVMMNAVCNREVEFPEDCPRKMALCCALAKEPSQRFASCTEFVETAAKSDSAHTVGIEASRDAEEKQGRHGVRSALCIVAIAIGLVALGGWWWLSGRENAGVHGTTETSGTTATKVVQVALVPSASPVSEVSPVPPRNGECREFTLPGGVKMEMIYVAPGSFTMGSSSGGSDEMPHQVRITKPYWIGKYPVTQSQWKSLVRANGVSFSKGEPTPYFSREGGGRDRVSGMDTSDFPMESISWEDCDVLVKALNRNRGATDEHVYSLPTEAQWEFAAKGGTKSRGYTYSGGNDMGELGWYYEDSGLRRLSESDLKSDTLKSNKCRTHSVKEKDVGNELGIVGMSGNVWEWCRDVYRGKFYDECKSREVVIDPDNQAPGVCRVLRGGCWNFYESSCRSANRSWHFPRDCGNDLGFRLCCSAGSCE